MKINLVWWTVLSIFVPSNKNNKTMYGARRITIEKSGRIVLAGNKSYIPIGRYHNVEGTLIGKLRNIDSWDLSLNETNSVDFKFGNTTELRNFVKKVYSTRLI